MKHQKVIKYLELLHIRKIVRRDVGDKKVDLRICKKIIDCFAQDWFDDNFDSLRASFRRTWTDEIDTSDEKLAWNSYKEQALHDDTGVRMDKLVDFAIKDVYKYCEKQIRPMRGASYDDLLGKANPDV